MRCQTGKHQHMPRQERTKSGSGIYHVMLRGINKQDIFEDDEDYLQMTVCLQGLTERYDENGVAVDPLCTVYSYCLILTRGQVPLCAHPISTRSQISLT